MEERRRERHDDARCRKAAGKRRENVEEEEEEEKEKEEERVSRAVGMEGEEKERGVRRGELPATRSPSIPRWNRRYVPSALYPHGTLAASFLSFSLFPSAVPPSPLPRTLPRAASYVYARAYSHDARVYTRAHTRPCEVHV